MRLRYDGRGVMRKTRGTFQATVLTLAGVGLVVTAGLTGYEAGRQAQPTVARVVCDSTAPEPVTDPRNPFLREVIQGCTLNDVNGAPVDVELID
jgi:hypothetical protein